MEHQDKIIFAISKTGASHIPKGIACQDSSLKFSDKGIRMIIVCDGHGSETYVRSDVGSRLATEISMDAILQFVKTTPIEMFSGKTGAVTARPAINDSLWGAVPSKPLECMTEIEQMKHRQDVSFYEQVKEIPEQDNLFQNLFQKIYNDWLKAIQADSEQHPFSDVEKTALGNHELVKAYGATLMAYVETPDYWFSFHIGDGRIVFVDEKMNMTNPVPWDCNCFLNFTSSLCNTNPVRLFRYAFDGTNHFPIAVFCCSDGVEDSFGDYDIAPYFLHNWYLGLLKEFVEKGEDITIQNISNFLPVMSQRGSKDDISLASIIDINAINPDIIANRIEAINIKKQIDDLDKNKAILIQQLHQIEQHIANYKGNV